MRCAGNMHSSYYKWNMAIICNPPIMLCATFVPCSLFSATVKLPPDKFTPSQSSSPGSSVPQEVPAEPKKIILNSSEDLFAELRDKNFNAVGPALSRKAKLISAQFDASTP